MLLAIGRPDNITQAGFLPGQPACHAQTMAACAPRFSDASQACADVGLFATTLTLQVRHLELHPVQPWLATASKSDVVTVWNWHTRQVSMGHA